MKKRALISVFDKTGVVEFAANLVRLGFEVVSTGGTLKLLKDKGIAVTGITEITGFPECLDGRVKTLHPVVHAGILAMRENKEHMATLDEFGIATIDVVAINLYPFRETVSKPECTMEDAIENIDIGGPTMLRSAAKNHKDVIVAVDPADYAWIVEGLEKEDISFNQKQLLALKVFEHTAHYDAMISDHLRRNIEGANQYPEKLTMAFDKASDLRYGENPHQKAVFYKDALPLTIGLAGAQQLHGKQLSFNNLNDAQAAINCVREFEETACVAVKHANPCGVGVGRDVFEAYTRAHDCDPKSIFGGIVAFNREVNVETAEKLHQIFLEIVIAPSFDEEALAILTQKKNIRLLVLDVAKVVPTYDVKRLSDGVLIQDENTELYTELKTVTDRLPTEKEMADLIFAYKVVKHVKSNGIVLAKGLQTVGLGPGQVNRIWPTENAIRQSEVETRGSVLASDAFFPFEDVVEAAAKAGVTAIIQPGGSMKDQDSIDKANAYGIAMVFTGMRHFKH
ncbi:MULTISPECIES: bifunctional phosphoribosylaminoimidazolecarboxamide formyltransferase/IMP cyclohydrolase [unclassified Fusibacter]|uniref:bifunctional phosphoribosylaminoimidazolecarboxamide formyltransferase/IMP cyclohydrolase n=1 Tax=unclassified Fusibacter TaxID=2624464 RepID=UPI001012D860|nr:MULTISPECIES: bifunctional phosphoribosylaminoimidazolecarboxamide formyltransferase/IMP cyclohydrolase [unclassified Fusibacter]MCK8059608.1 bifunctional phosphoribosylaminoimidazolecarboxamide formyltransferase/IMP cyclohydrolase [Fusibacter sp. A2]NPE21409.1 bifunctional phosphoribosylaminoimidazolecarboxamide formyltransferase/IMP cyclohydrolase [Fusibacter sp. A1]RXV61823.1 bifunctional phosphoribosylaminoimidazolecarboxamide formyltransferase/IMP cyclohydrolase PurH [Fusibacter sp. A1]